MGIKYNPKVSVILDNYNYARFLRQSIDSVLQQDYENYELIIVDDGSSDDSRLIIEEYADHDKRIIPVFKSNGGQMSAFNAAWSHVSGDVVAFLDSDDYWYSEKLSKIVEKHKEYHLVQHYLSNNGNGTYRKVNTAINWHNVLMSYGYLYNHSVCSSLSFDKKLLEPFFPFFEEEQMIYCADGILLMAALSLTEVGFIEEELGFYRVHGNNGFVGKDDYGENARLILKRQHEYVNKQLQKRGYKEIPFSFTDYFNHIIQDMLKNEKISSCSRILLYGTESSGLYMHEVLESAGIRVVGFIDSDERKQGKRVLNKPTYSPDNISQLNDWDCILIASSAQDAISKTLDRCGLKAEKNYYRLPI